MEAAKDTENMAEAVMALLDSLAEYSADEEDEERK